MGWWQPPTVGALAPSPAQPTFPFTVVFSDPGSSQQQQQAASAVLPRVTFLLRVAKYGDQVQPGRGRGQLASEYSANNAEMFPAAARPAVIV